MRCEHRCHRTVEIARAHSVREWQKFQYEIIHGEKYGIVNKNQAFSEKIVSFRKTN